MTYNSGDYSCHVIFITELPELLHTSQVPACSPSFSAPRFHSPSSQLSSDLLMTESRGRLHHSFLSSLLHLQLWTADCLIQTHLSGSRSPQLCCWQLLFILANFSSCVESCLGKVHCIFLYSHTHSTSNTRCVSIFPHGPFP